MAVFRKCNKINAIKKANYLDGLRKGLRRGEAAKSIGQDRTTIFKAMQADPDFAAEVDQAELDACEIIESALFKKAKKGNTTAMQVWLYNRWPDRWKDCRNLSKLNPVEALLACLPADLANTFRAFLSSQSAGPSPSRPSGQPRPDGSLPG